jgi:hypothetical protein
MGKDVVQPVQGLQADWAVLDEPLDDADGWNVDASDLTLEEYLEQAFLKATGASGGNLEHPKEQSEMQVEHEKELCNCGQQPVAVEVMARPENGEKELEFERSEIQVELATGEELDRCCPDVGALGVIAQFDQRRRGSEVAVLGKPIPLFKSKYKEQRKHEQIAFKDIFEECGPPSDRRSN